MDENKVPELPLMIEMFVRLSASDRVALLTVASRMMRHCHATPVRINASTGTIIDQPAVQ
ncbi:MAG: hypothetical protein NDI73_09620 [Desulfuromonadales bacterium]|nr:hypothetical protein [Desulfuromonadales bacterium]